MRLTPETELQLHLAKAREYWLSDQLEPAGAAMRNALRVGIPAGDWYDLQRIIEAELGARQTGVICQVDERLAIETDADYWRAAGVWLDPVARNAMRAVAAALSVSWTRPALITLFPLDEWLDFAHTRYGYYAARVSRHKICLPPSAHCSRYLFDRAARHELTHAAVNELGGGSVPRWLDEGLAVCLEQHGSPDLRVSGPRMRLDRISAGFTSYTTDVGGPEAARCYSQAAAFVHSLVARFGLSSIQALLKRLGDGESLERAFAAAFPLSLRDAEREWLAGTIPRKEDAQTRRRG